MDSDGGIDAGAKDSTEHPRCTTRKYFVDGASKLASLPLMSAGLGPVHPRREAPIGTTAWGESAFAGTRNNSACGITKSNAAA
jgi:hypothetical protein